MTYRSSRFDGSEEVTAKCDVCGRFYRELFERAREILQNGEPFKCLHCDELSAESSRVTGLVMVDGSWFLLG